MLIGDINGADWAGFRGKFYKCCSCEKWVEGIFGEAPFESERDLLEKAERIWLGLTKEDWLEAFAGHAKIGDLESLGKKYGNTGHWSREEQAGAAGVQRETLEELLEWNEKYERKFGFIFIVFATGKTASEMLEILKSRYPNPMPEELENAAREQNKITLNRIRKMIHP